jgi:putative Mg2+ transporter-C (MgtC) family protein
MGSMDTMTYLNELLIRGNSLTVWEVFIRLVLCVLVGGVIGLERGTHGHTAGFRTHILVCVGAALAMMTNQYIVLYLGVGSDMARLGAQVITGVGFLGVGTIIVTGRHRIKGLTTAAGLWASACLGLAIGIGFYFGAVLAAILIFMALAILPRMEGYFYEKSRIIDLYAEIYSAGALKGFKNHAMEAGISVCNVHLSHDAPMTANAVSLYFTVRIPKGMKKSDMMNMLEAQDFVYFVEEV